MAVATGPTPVGANGTRVVGANGADGTPLTPSTCYKCTSVVLFFEKKTYENLFICFSYIVLRFVVVEKLIYYCQRNI